MALLFHMHRPPVCSPGSHAFSCSNAPFTNLNEVSCVNRGSNYPLNVRCKCTHEVPAPPSGMLDLPVGTYLHATKPIGFTITRADKARAKKRKTTRK